MGVTSTPDWNTLRNKPSVVNTFNGASGAITGVSSINGATGAVANINAYDIGSFVVGRPFNGTSYAVGATVAGSSLYSTICAAVWNSAAGGIWSTLGTNTPAGQALVNVGSWRCVSAAAGDGASWGAVGLWVRYA